MDIAVLWVEQGEGDAFWDSAGYARAVKRRVAFAYHTNAARARELSVGCGGLAPASGWCGGFHSQTVRHPSVYRSPGE